MEALPDHERRTFSFKGGQVTCTVHVVGYSLRVWPAQSDKLVGFSSSGRFVIYPLRSLV